MSTCCVGYGGSRESVFADMLIVFKLASEAYQLASLLGKWARPKNVFGNVVSDEALGGKNVVQPLLGELRRHSRVNEVLSLNRKHYVGGAQHRLDRDGI